MRKIALVTECPEVPPWAASPTPEGEPTVSIPVDHPDCAPVDIQQTFLDPEFSGRPDGLWEVWKPVVDLDWTGNADAAECRAIADALHKAADALDEIAVTDPFEYTDDADDTDSTFEGTVP